MKIETHQVLNNPHARQAYYDELRKRRSKASAQKSEPPAPAPEPRPPSQAAELLDQLRAAPEPAPLEGEWEVRSRERQEWRQQKQTEAMLRLHYDAVRRRLRDLGIKGAIP